MQGIKNALAMQGVGLGMMKAKRLNPMEIFGGHKCKDQDGIKQHAGQGEGNRRAQKGISFLSCLFPPPAGREMRRATSR